MTVVCMCVYSMQPTACLCSSLRLSASHMLMCCLLACLPAQHTTQSDSCTCVCAFAYATTISCVTATVTAHFRLSMFPRMSTCDLLWVAPSCLPLRVMWCVNLLSPTRVHAANPPMIHLSAHTSGALSSPRGACYCCARSLAIISYHLLPAQTPFARFEVPASSVKRDGCVRACAQDVEGRVYYVMLCVKCSPGRTIWPVWELLQLGLDCMKRWVVILAVRAVSPAILPLCGFAIRNLECVKSSCAGVCGVSL